MLDLLQKVFRRIFEPIETGFNAIFGSDNNPFYQLGALSYYFFWIVAVSGLYLYIFFETSTSAAYESIEYLTHEQWYLGGIMRSLHRYASDAFVVAITLHLIREFSIGRYREFRWFSWISGVPLLWLAFASGIGGYWLVWDKLAQFVAISTSEWMDWLPFFGEPMARNFINQANINDRFFSLLSFVHIGFPLFLLLGMWIHTQRITSARTNPTRSLAIGTMVALLVLSLVKPALSQGGVANLDVAVTSVGLDWFYLNVYPLIYKWSPGAVWILLVGISTVLTVLPLLFRKHADKAAVVDLGNCNGCGRCFDDCPYGAVTMQERTDGASYETEAVVDPSLCVRCGICAGACPTSTPFRRATELIPGIDMPDLTVKALREQTLQATEGVQGTGRVIVYGCKHGAEIQSLKGPGVAVVELPCVAALPPSFIDFVIARKHVDGVLLTGCQHGDCYHRFGVDWMEQRIAGERDPFLRHKVPRDRIGTSWNSPAGSAGMKADLEALRQHLRSLDSEAGEETGVADSAVVANPGGEV